MVLRDLVLTRLRVPRRIQKRCRDVVDEITSSLTIGWFLSLFHSSLPLNVSIALCFAFSARLLLQSSYVSKRFNLQSREYSS